MVLSRYLKTYPLPEKPGRVLLVATRRCAVLELSDELWRRLRDGDELSLKEKEIFVRLGVLVASRETEREEMRTTFDTINNSSRRFEATVALTLECNLACPYCFEEPFRGNFVMSPETADNLVRFLSERMAGGFDVAVDFYGGEALLRLELLLNVATRLQEAAALHETLFTFNLFTNGLVLTRKLVLKLLPLGLQAVRLTIDGPPDIHDTQRPLTSGGESFHLILANLLDIYRLAPVDLGGNYTRHNYLRFPELLDLLMERGMEPNHLREVSFSPVMPNAEGKGGSDHTAACACSNEPWAMEAGIFLRSEIIRRGFPTSKLKPSACMIEFAHDVVVGYDGSLHKCPVFMGDEKMRVGSLTNGIGDYKASHSLDLWKNDECLECAYLPLCFGGCRFFSKLRSGAITDVECRRAYFDTTLERLIRQDLTM